MLSLPVPVTAATLSSKFDESVPPPVPRLTLLQLDSRPPRVRLQLQSASLPRWGRGPNPIPTRAHLIFAFCSGVWRSVPRLLHGRALLLQLRVGRTPVGAPCPGGDQEVRPDQLRGQMGDPDAHYPREQRLPLARDGRHWRVPCPAAVRHQHQFSEAETLFVLRLTSFAYRRGVASRLVIFPDENHWVLNHQNRSVVFVRISMRVAECYIA